MSAKEADFHSWSVARSEDSRQYAILLRFCASFCHIVCNSESVKWSGHSLTQRYCNHQLGGWWCYWAIASSVKGNCSVANLSPLHRPLLFRSYVRRPIDDMSEIRSVYKVSEVCGRRGLSPVHFRCLLLCRAPLCQSLFFDPRSTAKITSPAMLLDQPIREKVLGHFGGMLVRACHCGFGIEDFFS